MSRFLFVSILCVLFFSCSEEEVIYNYMEEGKASYYANLFIGRPTANGQTFTQDSLTAAHRKLPFGTKVKVTNVENGKSIEVVINDRGPFVRNRVIDLSRRGADSLDFLEQGVAKVKLQAYFEDTKKIKGKKERHLQTTSHLLFDVFREYDEDNLLYQQTFEEVRTFQLEEDRMRKALKRINNQKLIFSYPSRPTPFSFPIIVDSLNRDKLTSETLEDRIRKMTVELEK